MDTAACAIGDVKGECVTTKPSCMSPLNESENRSDGCNIMEVWKDNKEGNISRELFTSKPEIEDAGQDSVLSRLISPCDDVPINLSTFTSNSKPDSPSKSLLALISSGNRRVDNIDDDSDDEDVPEISRKRKRN